MKPLHWATSSLQTYPASRHKWYSVFVGGETTAALSKGSRAMLSCWLAALTSSEMGMPFSSTRMCRIEHFYPPIRRVWNSGLSGQRCFDARTLCCLPSPSDPLSFIVFGQIALPNFGEHTGNTLLLELVVKCRGTHPTKFFTGQGIPNDSSS